MLYPEALGPGSHVGVVAPSSPVREPYVSTGLAALRAAGLRPRPWPMDRKAHYYCAGPDEDRLRDLLEAFSDPDLDAIWMARGGYGCGRLLPGLRQRLPAPLHPPRTVVGCSDITLLLLYLMQQWNWVVFHGPMVAGDLGTHPSRADLPYLFSLLAHRPCRIEVSQTPLTVLRSGKDREASLTGGCLSLIAASLGTPWEIETDGRILFLEDMGTKPFQLDRMLTQLRQAGKLDRCAGLVFGEMPGCIQVENQGYTLSDSLLFALDGLDFPILSGLPSGHTETPSLPLALGARYRLSAEKANLILEDPVLLGRS